MLSSPIISESLMLAARVNSTYDPKTDPDNPLRYTPSNVLTTIAVAAFALISIGLTWRILKGRWRAKYMLAMTIGAYVMTFGFGMRYPLRNNPDSSGIYIIEDLAIVLSPCAFIATNYSILSRLAISTGSPQYVIIRASILTKLFVGSDICTFLIQAAGGTMSISKTKDTAKLGGDLFKIGMILQAASFIFFCIVYLAWILRVKSNEPQIWEMSKSMSVDGTPISHSGGSSFLNDWRAVAAALGFSCAGILIRCIYRTAEGLQGYHGSLATNETTFYLLDTLPLFLAVVVYIPIWPGNYIDTDAGPEGQYRQKVPLTDGYASRDALGQYAA